MKSHLFSAAFVAVIIGAPQLARAAEVKTLTASGDVVLIGEVFVSGSWRAVACVNDAFNWMRTDDGPGSLDQDVEISAVGGDDNVWFVRSSPYTPPTNADCGVTAGSSWRPLTFNGFYVSVSGGSGHDQLAGANGSVSVYLFGDEGNDYIWNYTTMGQNFGQSGNDQIVSQTTGSTEVLGGDVGTDCLWDTNAAAALFHCGPDTDYYHSVDIWIFQACELSTSCCGFC